MRFYSFLWRFLPGLFLFCVTTAPFQMRGAAFQFEGNGHWYEAIVHSDFARYRWADANANAQSSGGYLATITSQAENDFIAGLLFGYESRLFFPGLWIGAIQAANSVEPLGNWQWMTGEAFVYQNWWGQEPNNYGGNENGISIHTPVIGYTSDLVGKWNDDSTSGSHNIVFGYIVEYNSQPGIAPMSNVPDHPSWWLAFAIVLPLAIKALRRLKMGGALAV